MAPNPHQPFWITTTLIAGMAFAGGCGGFSMQTMTSTDSEETAPIAGAGEQAENRDGASRAAFVAGSEEENTKLARDFKSLLRIGEVASLFEEGEVFAKVESICGTKVWDQCQIAYDSDANDLGWPEWSFKRRDEDRVYVFPEMLYEEVEPLWAAATIEFLSKKGADSALFIKMVEDKCGSPLNTGCEVRSKPNGHAFRLTKRDSGEVIEVMSTLHDWKADL